MEKLLNSVKRLFNSVFGSISLNNVSLKHVGILAAVVAALAVVVGYAPATYLTIVVTTTMLLVSHKIADRDYAVLIGLIVAFLSVILSLVIKVWFIAAVLLGLVMFTTPVGSAATVLLIDAAHKAVGSKK